ncbi:MAG: YiiD C-terminal domain-containing protein [Actinomycetota bacterium]
MSAEREWDVARLTEATRASVPMAAQTRVEVVEAERGRVVLRMPLEGNGNHIGTMYAGALFALCEFPGGTLFSTTFDASRYYPIVKGVDISFRRFAGTDITVEASMSEEEAVRIAAAADEH